MPYFIASSILCVLALLIIYWLHNQYHLDIVVAPASPPAEAPLISVCVPARNEERNIRPCVESALAQDYPNLEVIALDDRSEDATPVILQDLAAKDSRLRVLRGAELPAGWAGKPHALFQASAAARGDWLCFVDADTTLAPQALSSCYAKALETQADLLTTMNEQVLGSFWEKAVMPLVMTALSVGFSPRKVNDPKTQDAVANGQFILIRREVYEALGGHAAVKDKIVEDKALAERVKWNGYRLVIADGRRFVRTRMYTSLPEMWEGWTKNIYLGLRDRPSLMWLGAFGAVLALLAALFLPVWPLLGIWRYLRGDGWVSLAIVVQSLAVWAALLLARALATRSMNISAWYAWTTPLGAGVFAAMMIASAWKTLSGRGVTWKGRAYKAG